MKIYFNGYPNHWLSPYTILEKVFFWREIDYDEPLIKKWVIVLSPFCYALQAVRKVLSPTIRYVKIDRYDTWSMDHTLAHIIHPMLIQLRDNKHGAPFVDDKDVPKDLRSTEADPAEQESYEVDGNHFKRWDWVLNEMIWSFEQTLKDDDEHQFFDYSVSNGKSPWDKDYVGPNLDLKGLKDHQKRKQNGFRLFGCYFQNLWD
jgi:hypothetical protein